MVTLKKTELAALKTSVPQMYIILNLKGRRAFRTPPISKFTDKPILKFHNKYYEIPESVIRMQSHPH